MPVSSYQKHPFEKGEKWHLLDSQVDTTQQWGTVVDVEDANHYKDVNSDLNTATAGNDGGPLLFDAIYIIPLETGSYEAAGIVEILPSYNKAVVAAGTAFTNAEFTLRTQLIPVDIAQVENTAEGTAVTTLAPNTRIDTQGFRHLYMRTMANNEAPGDGGTCRYAIYVKEVVNPNSTLDLTRDNRNA